MIAVGQTHHSCYCAVVAFDCDMGLVDDFHIDYKNPIADQKKNMSVVLGLLPLPMHTDVGLKQGMVAGSAGVAAVVAVAVVAAVVDSTGFAVVLAVAVVLVVDIVFVVVVVVVAAVDTAAAVVVVDVVVENWMLIRVVRD